MNIIERKRIVNEFNTAIYDTEYITNFVYDAIDLVQDIDWASDHDTFSFSSSGTGVIVIPIEGISGDIVISKKIGNRLKVALSNEYPKINNHWIQVDITASNKKVISLTEDFQYLSILFYSKVIDKNFTLEEILSTLQIYKIEDEEKINAKFKWDKISESLVSQINDTDKKLYNNFTANLFDVNKTDFVNIMKQANGNIFVGAGNIKSFTLPVLPNSTISIEKMITDRFIVYTSTEYPSIGKIINNTFNLDNRLTKGTFSTGENDYYITCYVASNSNTIDLEELKQSIKVYYGDNYIEKQLRTDEIQNEIDYIKPWFENENLINLCSYRPVGILNQGYICLTCDDGNPALVDYTIPKIIELSNKHNKNIPLTMALMDNSAVLNNQEQKVVVQNFIKEYNGSIAIHGSQSYTTFTTQELIDFLNTQNQRLAELCETAPTSIIYPNHDYNIITSTISGSYFGVCGTGGINKPIRYNGNMAGPRSNLYTLYRASLLNSSVTKDIIKTWIDKAYDEHLIIIPFWHDIDFARDGQNRTGAENLELLEYCIEYAFEKGLTFCHLGDIPNLT